MRPRGYYSELPALDVDQKQFENGTDTLLKEKNIKPISESTVFRHTYSHIDLKYKAITTDADHKKKVFDHYIDHKWIALEEFDNYAIHNAHKKIVEWYKNEFKN